MTRPPATASSSHEVSRLTRKALALLGLYVLLLLLISGVLISLLLFFLKLSAQVMYFFVPVLFLGIVLLVIWFAAVPRPVPAPPGVPVDLSTQPELQKLIQETAEAMQVPTPDSVRLLPDMNAYASERGVLKPQRTLGLGYPLFTLLTREEIKAVIAHELGHLSHGDTRRNWRLAGLGQSLRRTVQATHQVNRLDDDQPSAIQGYRAFMSLISLPLLAVARAFVGTTSQLSHLQEHAADAAASRLLGPEITSRALQRIAVNANLFDAFAWYYLTPLAQDGWRVPIAQGFNTYAAGQEAEIHRQRTVQHLNPDEDSLSHPSLRARLQTHLEVKDELKFMPATPATSLLAQAEELTTQFYAKGKKALKPISWEQLNTEYWPQQWQEMLSSSEAKGVLRDVTLSGLPAICADLNGHVRSRFKQLSYEGVGGDERHFTVNALALAFALALLQKGWAADVKPGHALTVRHGEQVIEPVTLLWEMVSSKQARETWMERMQARGIQDMALLHS